MVGRGTKAAVSCLFLKECGCEEGGDAQYGRPGMEEDVLVCAGSVLF